MPGIWSDGSRSSTVVTSHRNSQGKKTKSIVITDYEQSRTDTGFTKLILQITSFLLIGNTESGK